MTRIKLLNVDNQRRIFNVLSTLNLAKHEANVEKNNDFVSKFHKFLDSTIFEEKVWGIIGLLQHLKACLLNESRQNQEFELETQVETTLKTLFLKTKGHHRARAEVFYELTEIMKNEKLPKSDKLLYVGDQLELKFKQRFFKSKTQIMTQPFIESQFEGPKFTNSEFDTWIDIGELILNEELTLEGPILELIPYILFLKQHGVYKKRVLEKPEDPLERFEFVLKSNITISRATEPRYEHDTNEDLIQRCNAFYFATEWIRTVLNIFSECQKAPADSPQEEIKSEIDELLEKKYELLMECEGHLMKNIRRIKTYTLPAISRHLPKNMMVKYHEPAEVRRIKKTADTGRRNLNARTASTRRSVELELEEEQVSSRAASRQSRASIDQIELNDSRVENLREEDQNDDPDNMPENDPERDVMAEYDDIPVKSKKPKSINLEKLRWYFTPLSLATTCRLIDIINMKRGRILNLIENLQLLLKYAIPSPGRQIPINFGVNPPLPQAKMNHGQPQKVIEEISKIMPKLFEFLVDCVNHFRMHPIKEATDFNGNHKQFMQNFKILVQIFAKVFQSKDTDLEDEEYGTNISRKIYYKLCGAINMFNASRQPLKLVFTGQATRTTSFNFSDDSGSRVLPEEDFISPIIEYFIEIAPFAPTIEIGSGILDVLKMDLSKIDLEGRNEICAKVALSYLAKEWIQLEKDDKTANEKAILKILNDYFDFRQESEQNTAILWLLFNSFDKLTSEQFTRSHKFDEDRESIKDREEIVGQYKDSHFASFNPKTAPAVHQIFYRRFNFYVSKALDKKILENKSPITVLKEWNTVSNTYLYLNIVSRVEEFRKGKRLLVTCVRESRRFIESIMHKNSSFMELFSKPKEEISRYAHDLLEIFRRIQTAHRIVQSILTYAKQKKWVVILKLIPDWRTSMEKFMNEIYKKSHKAGFGDAITFGKVRPRTIDGKEVSDETATDMTTNTTRRRGRTLNITNTPMAGRRTTDMTNDTTRKRGRASNLTTNTSRGQDVTDTTTTSAPNGGVEPKKRGRPRKSLDSLSDQPGPSTSRTSEPKKRGRKPKNATL